MTSVIAVPVTDFEVFVVNVERKQELELIDVSTLPGQSEPSSACAFSEFLDAVDAQAHRGRRVETYRDVHGHIDVAVNELSGEYV